MYNLNDWLTKKLSMYCANNSLLIDVGAYHGDFTQQLLATEKFSKAILFEPNNDHFNYLKNKFANEKNIFLSQYALGSETGVHNFYCSQDDATGSLLQYHPQYHHESAAKTVSSSSIEVVKLDDFCMQHCFQEKIGLIKIDTQGFDLEVLKGAEQTIKKHQPWLVIELNFLPFYASQAPIHTLFNWLMDCKYQLAGFFNDHYSHDQWLAFADGVFIPEGIIDKVNEPFSSPLSFQHLVNQNKLLEDTCQQRLNLINELNHTAEQRLQIINQLNEQLKMVPRKKSSWWKRKVK